MQRYDSFRVVLVLILSGFFISNAYSQAPFFQGKSITVIQATEAGGSSDMLTRPVLTHLRKYIPGNPTIVTEYMPGGGGTKAANHIFKNARPDGLIIGRIGGALVPNAVLGEKGVLYDLNKFIYLGSPHNTYQWVFITRRDAGLKSIEALQAASGVRIGAQAVGHSNYFVGRMFALLIGIKDPKMVVGYGGTELDIALVNGEIDARINSPDTLLKRNPEWIANRTVDIHAIMNVPRSLKEETFTKLPEIDSFAKTERERKLLAMVRAFRQFGSPFILPPNTPKDRVKILQDAMAKTFRDPEFAKDYKKFTGDEPTPLFPDEMERMIVDMPRDPETIALFKQLNAAGPLPAR